MWVLSSTQCQFSIIIEPLFESYNGMVSTASMEDLCRSTLSWLDHHCSLPALRPSESSPTGSSVQTWTQCSHWTLSITAVLFCLLSQWFWVHSVSWVPPQPSWQTPASCQSRRPSLSPRVTPLLPWMSPYCLPLRTVYSPCDSAAQTLWKLKSTTMHKRQTVRGDHSAHRPLIKKHKQLVSPAA